jgi:aquaporin Z
LDNIRKYLAEFIGTFALVFFGTGVATLQGFVDYGDAGYLAICAAFGGTLTVLVLAIGPVSGCHVNPAVTIPMALAGRLSAGLLPGYLIAQFAGAIAASGTLFALLSAIPGYGLGDHGLGANGNPEEVQLWALFTFELLMTALFVFTIFAVTRPAAVPGFAAIAIGGFLFVAHLFGAPLGDSSLNPARSLGPALFVGDAAIGILWVFVVGPVIGGIAGWLAYKFVYKD